MLQSSEEFRSRVLWHVERWARDKEDGEAWIRLIPLFIEHVWPKQNLVRSSTSSAHLFDIAFACGERFPEIVELIVPLLSKVEGDRIFLPEFREGGGEIVNRYPGESLLLLWAVLPDDASRWPYGIEKMIQKIEAADATLVTDEKLISLKRRLAAR